MDEHELYAIERGKAMKKLIATPEFRQLILEDYIENQAVDTGTAFTGSVDDIDTLKSISNLNQYIQTILLDADLAKQQ